MGQQAMKLLCIYIYIYNGLPRAFLVGRRSRAESAEPGVIDGTAMPEEASEVKTRVLICCVFFTFFFLSTVSLVEGYGSSALLRRRRQLVTEVGEGSNSFIKPQKANK
ncbi:hypothetical protein ACFX2K_035123 [Malus domestica]